MFLRADGRSVRAGILVFVAVLLAGLGAAAQTGALPSGRPLIVFMTDFGTVDDAVPICKGVMLGIVPDVLRHFGAGGALIPLAVPMALVFGCALGALLIPAFIVLQERTTPASRGRIFGGIFTVINAAVAIPLLLAGVIADVLGVDRVVAALGVLLILLAAYLPPGVGSLIIIH